jgi:hypothetical protein
VASRLDPNGNEVVSFTVTNSSLELFPHFAAVKTPDGDAPLYVVDTESPEGWQKSARPTSYSFTHFLRPITSWQFQVSFAATNRPRRVVLFYTLGHRQLPPVLHQLRQGWMRLGGSEEIRELQSEPVPVNKIGAGNERQLLRSEPIRTSAVAGSPPESPNVKVIGPLTPADAAEIERVVLRERAALIGGEFAPHRISNLSAAEKGTQLGRILRERMAARLRSIGTRDGQEAIVVFVDQWNTNVAYDYQLQRTTNGWSVVGVGYREPSRNR